MPGGRSLCLDVGERRIGVAVSDSEGWLASPVLVLERREAQRDFARIAALVQEQAALRVVVGLPQSLDGGIGPQARRRDAVAGRVGPHPPGALVDLGETDPYAAAAQPLAPAP